MARPQKGRIDGQPAFILHQYPYRETSRLLDVFSRDHGRLMLVARGAQRPGSQLRAVLLGFQPVLLSWFGEGEVKTLHAAEWQGGVPQLSGQSLLCGFYINELLMRFLPRDDAHRALFVAYFNAIRDLAHLTEGGSVEPILRNFERELLQESGYGVNWLQTDSGETVESDGQYGFQSGRGIVAPYEGAPVFDGHALLAFAAGDLSCDKVLIQAKTLMRQVLGGILGDEVLHTRQLLIDLQKL